MINEDLIKKTIKDGISSESINYALFLGWDLVCPNNQIDFNNGELSYSEKDKNGKKTQISNKFSELDEKVKSTLVRENKEAQLTTSQIRNVFGELRRIQLNGYLNEKTAFLLIKPKLAYAVKRHKKKGIELFYDIFSIAYDAVDTNNEELGSRHFENLMNFMEAVLAYHKFFGGKE